MSSISPFTTRFIKKSISWLFLEIHFLGNFKRDGYSPRKMTFFFQIKKKKKLFLKIIVVKGGLFDTKKWLFLVNSFFSFFIEKFGMTGTSQIGAKEQKFTVLHPYLMSNFVFIRTLFLIIGFLSITEHSVWCLLFGGGVCWYQPTSDVIVMSV